MRSEFAASRSGGLDQVTTIVHTGSTLLLLCASVLSINAQNVIPKKDTSLCFEVDGDRMGYSSLAPFTATWTYTRVVKNADGTSSTSAITKTISRDSSGRVFVENSHSAGNLKSHSTNFWVDDPTKNVYFGWTEGAKEVFLWHTSRSREELLRKDPRMTVMWAEPLCAESDRSADGYKTENLGTKTILGIEAEGTLATRVFPAGFEGFAEPATITEERWISRDLQLTLANTVTDSRFGKATLELQSINRLEPRPELFQFPAGLTVVDAPTANSPAH